MSLPKPDRRYSIGELCPVDWSAITPHFRAGLRSIKSIGKEFGVSDVAIIKHFRRLGISRDLKARIHEVAAEKVRAAEVRASVSALTPQTVQLTVEVNAQVIALLQMKHRGMGADAAALVIRQMAELGQGTDSPDLFMRVAELLESLDDEPTAGQRTDMYAALSLIASLPARAKVLKDLVDSMQKIIGVEREAFGLNTDDGSGGDRFTVIVRDYTGRVYDPPEGQL